MKHLPTRCVCVDVDGTLVINGKLNEKLATWARRKKEDGFEMILWSARGRAHAEEQADKFNVRDCFTDVISKPGYIVDDLGWTWQQYTRVLPIIPEDATEGSREALEGAGETVSPPQKNRGSSQNETPKA